MISGKSTQATSTHASHLVQSCDECSREEITESFKGTTTVPTDHVAAMKLTLNLPLESFVRCAQPRSQTVSVGGGKIIFLLFL